MWRLITFPFQPPMFHGVPLTRRTNIRGIPFFHLGSAIHFVVISTDANIASILALSVVLSCDSNYFSRSYENCTFITPMAVIRVSSVIRRNERRLNSEPYVCSTTFGRATLGASDVPKKLFLAFLFRDPDVGVLLEDVGLVRSTMVCCKCGFQMSLCVDTNRKDGCR